MAEQILYDDLYNQLTPKEQFDYGGYKIARNLVPSESDTQDKAFPEYKEVLDAEQAAKATKPSAWNPMNWIFSPAASSEMPQNKYGLQTNTMGGVTLNPDGSLNYNNQSPNLGFRSMVDMAADTENFDNQFNNNFADAEMTAPFYNTMRGSVIGQDMDIRDYQSPMGTDVIGMDEMNTYGQVPVKNHFNIHGVHPSAFDPYGNKKMALENPEKDFYENQNWFERMMSGAQDKLGGAWGKTKELGARFKEGAKPVFGLASMLANAGNPLNPNSFNFNPDLAAQLNFMDQNFPGALINNPSSGLLQYAQGTPLAGQAGMSLFGSNDPIKQLEKQLARRQKTYDNLENQWGNTLTAEELEAKKQNYFDKFLNPTTSWLGKVKADQKVRIDKKNAALELKEKQKEDRKKGITYSGPQTYNYNPNIQKTGPTYGPHQGSGGGNWGPAGKSPSSGGYSRGSYGGRGHHWARGGRVGYANGGLASLFTRRG